MLCVYDLLTVRGDTRDKIKKTQALGLSLLSWSRACGGQL